MAAAKLIEEQERQAKKEMMERVQAEKAAAKLAQEQELQEKKATPPPPGRSGALVCFKVCPLRIKRGFGVPATIWATFTPSAKQKQRTSYGR